MAEGEAEALLTPIHGMNPQHIKNSHYTATLLEEGLRSGALDSAEMVAFQSGLFETLGEMVELYTHGESSSVLTDTAAQLLDGTIFLTDCALLSLRDHEKALEAIKSIHPRELRYVGVRYVKRIMAEATGLFVKVRHTAQNIPNNLYREVTGEHFKKLMRGYDYRLNAHIAGVPDYPLAVSCASLRGAFFFKGYLTNLYKENLFCRDYDAETVNLIFKSFCDRFGFGYDIANVNIYSLVLANALFAALLEKEPGSAGLSLADCRRLSDKFTGMGEAKQKKLLRAQAAALTEGDRGYNLAAYAALEPGILNAIAHGRLANYLVITY